MNWNQYTNTPYNNNPPPVPAYSYSSPYGNNPIRYYVNQLDQSNYANQGYSYQNQPTYQQPPPQYYTPPPFEQPPNNFYQQAPPSVNYGSYQPVHFQPLSRSGKKKALIIGINYLNDPKCRLRGTEIWFVF